MADERPDPGADERPDPRDEERAEDEGLAESYPPLPEKEITGDPQEGLLLPRRDHARAAGSFGTTADEQREGEPLGDRLDEEQPDVEPGDRDEAGRLVEEDRGLTDQEKDEVAEEAPSDSHGRTAEEAAMRVEDEAPGGGSEPGDRYVDEP
ncbi:MAG TPA: DUF5709 domain-containing protein [Actinomycetota bacterium]|nr:DUF5709 domain-containing protein [Actinomycetota bacterium]